MSLRIKVRPEAAAEALEAQSWYEERRKGLGTIFAAAVQEIVFRIGRQPLLYPRVRGEMRRAVLRSFPYAVYFRILPEEIVVLAVVHGRRNPNRWRSRE